MGILGKTMQEKGVKFVLFVHGTFVGPMGVLSLVPGLGTMLPLSPALAPSQSNTRTVGDAFVGDVSNYTAEYVRAFESATKITSNRFLWSSENNNRARLDAAVELAVHLCSLIDGGRVVGHGPHRILVHAHSHGGQVLALLTHLLSAIQGSGEDGPGTCDHYSTSNGEALGFGTQLFHFLNKYPHASIGLDELQRCLKVVSSVHLDIVTFGTPVRILWASYERFRLLPFVNHRSESSLWGALVARDGDYIQDWAIQGTDTPRHFAHGEEDAALASVIGDAGAFAPTLLASFLRAGKAPQAASVHKCGRRCPVYYGTGIEVESNVYIDYEDDKNSSQLFAATDSHMGHGVYTKRNAMLFNAIQISKRWYDGAGDDEEGDEGLVATFKFNK